MRATLLFGARHGRLTIVHAALCTLYPFVDEFAVGQSREPRLTRIGFESSRLAGHIRVGPRDVHPAGVRVLQHCKSNVDLIVDHYGPTIDWIKRVTARADSRLDGRPGFH